MEGRKIKLQRNVSAKVIRHEQAIEKYKNYQANKNNDEKLNDMMIGQVHKEYVSRPGEFMVVSSGKVEDKNKFLDIPLFSLLDGTKTFSELKSQSQKNLQKKVQQQQQQNMLKSNSLNPFNKRSQTSKLSNYLVDSQYQIKSINEEDNFIQIDEANESFDNNNKKNTQQRHELGVINENAQTRFTKNIKIILDKQHINFLSPTTKVMKIVVENNVKKEGTPDKKLIEMLNRVNSAKIKPLRPISSVQMVSITDPRPISAQFMIENLQYENAERATESKLVQEALLKEQKNLDKITKKRSSYQSSVPEYKRTVKHITGYNTVKLEQEDYEKKWNYHPNKEKKENHHQQRIKTAIDFSKQSPYLRGNLNAEKLIMRQMGIVNQEQIVQEVTDTKQGNFLPLDYYNLDDDDLNPQLILEKYKDENGNVWGYSKYFDNHGNYEWEQCQVIKYDNQKDMFLIQWESSKQKYVSRVNLRFKNENQQDFQRKLQAAEYYREMSEIYLKYNYIIDTMETETSNLNNECVERIKVLVAGFTFKLNQLRDPIKYFKLEPSIKYNMKRQLIPKQILNCEKKSEENIKNEYQQKENLIKKQQPTTSTNTNSSPNKKNTDPDQQNERHRKEQVPKQVITAQGKQPEEIFNEKRFKKDVIQSIVEEIKHEFIRANHKVEYNNSLPYHEERQKLFKNMLPDELFEPIIDKPRKESDQIGCLDAGYPHNHKPIHFINQFKKMSSMMHVANKERLEILSNMNASLMHFSQQQLVINTFKSPMQQQDFKKQFENKFQDVIRELTLKISDTNIDIINMVKEEIRIVQKKNQELIRSVATEEQKKIYFEQELSNEAILSLKNFQNVLNMLYERSARQVYEDSIKHYINYFKNIVLKFKKVNEINSDEEITQEKVEFQQILLYMDENRYQLFNKNQLTCFVKLQKQEGKVELFPNIDDWYKEIIAVHGKILDALKQISCLKYNKIGSARENGRLKLFDSDKDELLIQNQKDLDFYIDQAFVIIKTFLKKQKDFDFLMDLTKESITKKMEKKNNFKNFEKWLQKIKQAKQDIETWLFQDKLWLGIFQVEVIDFKQQVENKIQICTQAIYKVLINKINSENEKIENEILEIMRKFKTLPKNIEELHALRIFCNVTLGEILDNIQIRISEVMDKMNLLEEMHYKISFEDFSKSWSIYGMPLKLRKKKEKCLKKLEGLEKEFWEGLIINQQDMAIEIRNISIELDYMMKETDVDQTDDISYRFYQLGVKIDNALRDAEIINKREAILKLKLTDYSELEKLSKQFSPYNRVWQLSKDYSFKIPNIEEGPLNQVDKDQVTNDIIDSWNELVKLEKGVFKNVTDMKVVTQKVRQKYESFKPKLPIINDLRNPAFMKRHWAKINAIIDEYNQKCEDSSKLILKKFEDDQQLTLKTLFENNIMEIKDEIREISEIASKEKGFEKILQKMKSEWKPIKLEFVQFRNTDTVILKGIEPIMDKLDEDIAKTLSIASSPFIKFLENEVIYWRNTLFRLQETIEAWCKVQKLWSYLQPIFYSEDIIAAMQKEGQKYSNVDKNWRSIMQQSQINPSVMEACFQNRLKESFVHMIEQLEQVIKGLNEYLNKKRTAFPRFYFLSNDELLSILAQTREPRAVQRHLPKCFEGIEYLTFQDVTSKITHMNSIEDEHIQFNKEINPLDQNGSPRGVEEWLLEIEKCMKSTLLEQFVQTLQDFKQTERKQWLLKWPAQLIVGADQTIWTSNVTDAILNLQNDINSLQNYYQKLNNLLLEIVELVRGDVSKVHRITLGVLVVIEVHAKDVVKEVIEQQVKDPNDFEWLAQMRYYYEKDLEVKMVNTGRKYGFEYLGNQGRLVITPLTDRCYRTLMSALQQNLGGAPEGPAGTGKTETTKDLAKALAKHCVVFNCSDSLDYMAMGKFFKGLCSCGSWACFDEFNRIELEVLSVIAQQILTIQTAIFKQSTSRFPSATFQFEGVQIPLDASCAVFITMNPGYQGRSELPDNLKALFRPVAMMIPNYAMITEISLYSYGFVDARNLSIKITCALKLASEQLSTQSHYDFGMRAVKAIIIAAGSLKRNFPETHESLLILRAISDCNLPKFTSKDVPLFHAILSDLFPDVKPQQPNYGELDVAIKEVMKSNNYVLKENFHRKIIELYETIQVRHGLMVVGSTNSGKSTILNTLATAIEKKNHKLALQELGLQENIEQPIPEEDQPPEQISLVQLQHNQPAHRQSILGNRKSISRASQLIRSGSRRYSLLQSLIQLSQPKEKEVQVDYQKVFFHPLNPKAVTSKLLYGEVEQTSGEWHNGITAIIFRECQEVKSQNLHWILFDGPVDALWIENMNTVLDDNKKLCLSNGETIKLTEQMSIIFEVEDLLEASPATVSRCGMVYLESRDLGWEPFFDPWFCNLTENFKTFDHIDLFQVLIKSFLKECIDFVLFSKNCDTCIPVSDQWIAMNFFRLFESYLYKNKTKEQILQDLEIEKEREEAKIAAAKLEGKEVPAETKKRKNMLLGEKERGEVFAQFLMSLIWSIGVVIESVNDRKKFHDKVHSLISKIKEVPELKQIPNSCIPTDENNIFDIQYDLEKKAWNLWKGNTEYRIPLETEFHNIFVPTSDSIRHHFILQMLTVHSFPTLFLGKTGTGKTITIKKFLINDLANDKYITSLTAFSANTNCNQVQDILESKLEKQKRRKGVLGPLIGRTNIIFIDDLNMPNKETYGAQPPLELIRQWFCFGGWYDRKTLEFNKIIDIHFTAAMGMGRPALSNRLLRHFNLVYLNEMENTTLSIMVEKIFDWGFNDYIDKVKFQIKNFKNIIIQVHKMISQTFLPLPKKSHYIFNLRDLMKVVQGLLSVPATQYEATQDNRLKLARLWAHESYCIYSDRLVDNYDKEMFNKILDQVVKENLQISLEEIIYPKIDYSLQGGDNPQEEIEEKPTHRKFPVYCNFLENNSIYHEVEDWQKIRNSALKYIDDYNEQMKKKINIILFDDAIKMLCKISRIISNLFSHGLLIGLGGAGSHTLTRLATYMQGYTIYEIEVDKDFGKENWLEFIREMLKELVIKDKIGIFLISDSQIIDEKFLEDINNLLNIGEIPNLYASEDKENLISELKDITEKQKLNLNTMQLWEYFVNKCKMNLHIVLCLSPIGEKLRQRLRNFPSLVSCTSPIWVHPWSKQALQEVAMYTIKEDSEELKLDSQMTQNIAEICLHFHQTVISINQSYLAETGKYYYVTPISYMKLLSNFKSLYQKKIDQIIQQRDTYQNGVEKLDECTLEVGKMKLQLEKIQPILEKQTQETEEIMKQVELETIEADKQRQMVQEDEQRTSEKADIAKAIKDQCNEKLSVAEPALQEALDALKTIKVNDFVQMKSYQKPPQLIKMTMDAVCILMGQKGKKSTEKPGEIDFWDDARKLLSYPNEFIKKLEKFDRDNIPDPVISKFDAFKKKNPTFKPANIAKASGAAEGLCKWTLAIYEYHFVYKSILPLRQDLDKAQKNLEQANQELEKKREILAQVEAKCQALKKKFNDANMEKQKLIAEKNDCEVKLKRALHLTEGLSSEKIRWSESSIKLTEEISNLLGDIILSVGFISYLGAFTAAFRKKIVFDYWIPKIISQNVICNRNFSLIERIGDPMQIQEWILHGLPLDDVSKENAIIMYNNDNWPLIIDPQNQATRFIKRIETKLGDKNFVSIKVSKQMQSHIENAINKGKTLMIQGVGEVLDPILDSILVKNNIFMQGGRRMIQIGQQPVEYNPNFRLYLICNLPNPHYMPETLTKITLLNFTITPEAMTDQMLSILAKEEDPNLEEEKIRLMEENAENKQRMEEIERNILKLLRNTPGNKMLESEELIDCLKVSKKTSEEVQFRQQESKSTEQRIIYMRQQYYIVAQLSSAIYFTVLQLSSLDPMYQFSLEFFVRMYKKSIKLAEKPQPKKIEIRVKNLIESLKKCIYYEMQRSIFVKHKLLFSLMLTFTCLQVNNQIDQEEMKFLLTGLSSKQPQFQAFPKPNNDIFTELFWEQILHVSNLPNFQNLAQNIIDNTDQYISFIENIHNPEYHPDQIKSLSFFQKLVLTRVLRPDYFVEQVRQFITQEMGSYYISNLIITLNDCFQESAAHIPLIFVLSPGDDPQDDLKKFAQEKGKYITFVSLGKGQGDFAESNIREAMQAGQWCLLQNCHLAVSWLPRLEEIVEEAALSIQKKDKDRLLNSDFRLWLTSMSSDSFPMYLLQEGVKMTKDPPKGVKANVQQLYSNQNSTKDEVKYFQECEKMDEWRRLYMSLTFFHSVVRERRRFGPIGWNIYYDFNSSDFKISMRQLKQMLNDYETIPFKALSYLTGECYYGGKVTDDWDRRILRALLSDFYNDNVLYEDYRFSAVQEFYIPQQNELIDTLDNTISYINSLPDLNEPELFGLHSNAAISSAKFEATFIINSLVQVNSGKKKGGSEDANKQILERVHELLDTLPQDFKVNFVREKFKINYYESMNTVLTQEVLRYNNLLGIIRESLKDLIQAMQGFKVMTNVLDNVQESLQNNVIPQSWASKSYPSLKPLMSYHKDLIKRIEMFQEWIHNGIPTAFWISGFFFTQSFFTGIRQNYARKQTIPIDLIDFNFEVIDDQQRPQQSPEKGCYCYGLFLEGAKWDYINHHLEEQEPKVIYQDMPIVWFIPTQQKQQESINFINYQCPMYKTSERKGTLSTTGHSTNFVIAIDLPTKKQESHWVKRGVALISQLND